MESSLVHSDAWLDHSARITRFALRGAVSAGEIDSLWARLARTPGYDPTQPVLVDFSGWRLTPAATALIRQRAANPMPTARGRIALVAPSDASYGLARMYQQIAEASRDDIEVFRGEGDALRWLAQ